MVYGRGNDLTVATRKMKGRVDPAFSFKQKSVVLVSEGTSPGPPLDGRPVYKATL